MSKTEKRLMQTEDITDQTHLVADVLTNNTYL